jgi:hypothetical protein
VSVSVLIGLVFALATALASIVGFLYKHRGAVESPDVEFRRPVSTSVRLFRSKWYSLGIIIALTGWGFHVAALSLAPISLVQSVIAGGLVLLTVTADRVFGHSVTRREWIGVGLAAVGLAFLAATLEGAGQEAHSSFEPAVLWSYIALCSILAVGVAAWGFGTQRAGIMFAASAGLMWAASDTSIKAVSDDLGESVFTLLVDPLILVIFFASMAGLVVSARSLQIGKAVPVIAVTSVAANAFTIAAGPIVFGEPVPEDPLGLVVRIAAFALVIVAAALTPAPVSAAHPKPA